MYCINTFNGHVTFTNVHKIQYELKMIVLLKHVGNIVSICYRSRGSGESIDTWAGPQGSAVLLIFYPLNAEPGFCNLEREVVPLKSTSKHPRLCTKSRQFDLFCWVGLYRYCTVQRFYAGQICYEL
jgi:hypothetical protein